MSTKQEVSLLSRKLAETPIQMPANPFWDVFKRFGRDEAIAMVINVLGTGAIDIFLNSNSAITLAGPISRRTKDLILSISGPVVEKAGFFPAHFYEALTEYRSTPDEERDALSTYFKRATRGGMKSLAYDVAVHDPLYVAMMWLGLKTLPTTPAWLLALGSFVGAVFAVAGLEVGITELAYMNHKRSLRKAGFGLETYFESRFAISVDKDPEQVLDAVKAEFNLLEQSTHKYHDRYFQNHLPSYSGRIPKLRLRQRTDEDGTRIQTAQIVYTRTSELATGAEQFRYFPQRKDKMYFLLDHEMPESLDEVRDKIAQRILKRAQKQTDALDIRFERAIARDPKALLIAVDKVETTRPFFIVELKVHKDKGLLREAMRFVMKEFPVVQTTHGKYDLSSWS